MALNAHLLAQSLVQNKCLIVPIRSRLLYALLCKSIDYIIVCIEVGNMLSMVESIQHLKISYS